MHTGRSRVRSIENSDKIRQASAGTMAICVRVYG